MARGTLYNLAGHGLPLLAAVLTIPLIDAGLGTERYGVLLILFSVIGTFSLFDLGLSRALTQLTSEKLAQEDAQALPPLVWTALALTFGVGLTGGAGLALISPWIVPHVISAEDVLLRWDTLHAFYVLAASVPVVVSTASLRGVLEARQWFGVVNAVRVPLGVYTFAAPLLALSAPAPLTAISVVLIAGRVVAWATYFFATLRALPDLGSHVAIQPRLCGPLFRFGGWMTVSNVISPVLVYADRFIIGAVLSGTAVAYYATPWELVTKLLLIATAFSTVLFPFFSYWQIRDRDRLQRYYYAAIKLMALVLLPLSLGFILFAEPLLQAWMGSEYALHGTRPLQLLAIGVFLNGLSSIPFALLQGIGRPDVTAKLHLAELPVYLLLISFLVTYGITGIAIAWVLRVALDFLLLMWMSHDHVPAKTEIVRLLGSVLGALLILSLAMLPFPLELAVLSLMCATALYAWSLNRYLFLESERTFFRTFLNKVSSNVSS